MIRYVAIIIKDNDYVNVLTNIAKHVMNFIHYNPIYPEVVDEFVLKEFITITTFLLCNIISPSFIFVM